MSEYADGFSLTAEELVALMALCGKESILGFQYQDFSKEKLMDAYCRLMEDKAMTQIDGKYRFHKDLFRVIVPIVNAKRVAMVIPGNPDYSGVVYYMDHQVTMLQPTAFGRLSMFPLEKDQLAQSVVDHMDLNMVFESSQAEMPEELLVDAAELQTEMKTLVEDSWFVVQWMDAETKKQIGWIRITEEDFIYHVEWTGETVHRRDVLTKNLLQELMKGEWL